MEAKTENTRDSIQNQKTFGNGLNRDAFKHKMLTSDADINLTPHTGYAAGDFLAMVRESDHFKYRPDWDRCQNSLTLSMIESRKKLNTAQRLLEEKEEEFSNYCKERDKQIADVKEKEQKLKESFEFFDEFVKENIEKRQRAEEKIIKEKETRGKLNNEIESMNRRTKRLNELKENMISDIRENGKFERYLLMVGKMLPQDFDSQPEKIIERYTLLKDVQDELSRLQKQQIESLQETSKEIDNETERRSEQLIDLNNLLTDLYNRRQVSGQEAWKWKCILNRVTVAAAEMALETEQAQTASDDLYLQVYKDVGKPAQARDLSKNNEKLNIILDRILELHQILKVAKERISCNYSNRPNSALSKPRKENPKPRTRP